MSTRLVVRNTQAPGDILVLSAALRDLHIAHPGLYNTDIWVSRGAEEIYWNNPDVDMVHKNRPPPGSKHFVAHYPLIKSCNQQRKHFLWGFPEYFNQKLGTDVKLTEFRPKIVLTQQEAAERPFPDPYWVFLSGGKKDFPAKIWDQTWWAEVIRTTQDDINWVQCGGGSSNHIKHKAKAGVYADMVAKTSCRDFLKLIYHSEGVVCAVTFAMHVAAAFNKPCVVIAGGREPWWWEAYNEENRLVNMRVADPKWEPPADDTFVPHKFLHTIGKLDCCHSHGCWKSKVTGGANACKNVVKQNGEVIPKCLSMITPDMVVDAINSYSGTLVRPSSDSVEIIPTPSYRFLVNEAAVPAEDRVRLLLNEKAIAEQDDEWIVWYEPGSKLADRWEYVLKKLGTKPKIFGRPHRTADGKYYPYPGGFIVHHSLLQDADSFVGLFEGIDPRQYRPVEGLMQLSTRPMDVT